MNLSSDVMTAAALLQAETALFASFGILVIGLSDLVVDLLWLGLLFRRRVAPGLRPPHSRLDLIPPPATLGRFAIFVPAWDEAAVIRRMIENMLAVLEHDNYRIYVGCYRNDPETISEVEAIADDRVRIVVGPISGPTTKGDCLNRLWLKMVEDEIADGATFKAIVLHDAEDVVHPAELQVFDSLIEGADLIQLPVIPLIHAHSRWIGGHYADEFAEAHAKELVVRSSLGAALPSAGVGCAFSRDALARLAEHGNGLPFAADSLVEDYELGLKLRRLGGRTAFVRVRTARRNELIGTKGFFPGTARAAIAQKARWTAGIALSGWDRLGWSGGLAERWMRLRDRQSLLSAFLMVIGYLSLLLWAALSGAALAGLADKPTVSESLSILLWINLAILLWRMGMRFGFTTHSYGAWQGVLSLPRMIVGNFIAICAAWQAVARYQEGRTGGEVRWNKTAHIFPIQSDEGC